ncbi:hypothetical protein ABEB36_013669 [Hypothenemus hampei]|uniref:Uncharacterized protein n=1 Tax=Hypothenemus hampei TaxID=57062 RepID=A0ABD1E543_HYPHA
MTMLKTCCLLFTILSCLIITVNSERTQRDETYFKPYLYPRGGDNQNYEPLNVPLQESPLYILGTDSFLPFAPDTTLASPKFKISPVAYSNSIEKPVQEPSDPVPQPPRITAVIPLQPPPAVPVNAAAANVPANNGAVFLGSGALGVVNLGNGAFALGSGGIGYSNIRQQPRPSGQSPLYPPLAATPNLVPAATPSQPPLSIPQPNLAGQLTPDGAYQFNSPLFTPQTRQMKEVDQNGYERLSSPGFGNQTPRIRPIKTRMNYATLTVPQVTVEIAHPNQMAQPGFGDPIPRLPPQAIKFVN